MSVPKSLAERLAWMAANLPGFQEEIDEVNRIERAARQRECGHSNAQSPASFIQPALGASLTGSRA